jgi:hypothetical protein
LGESPSAGAGPGFGSGLFSAKACPVGSGPASPDASASAKDSDGVRSPRKHATPEYVRSFQVMPIDQLPDDLAKFAMAVEAMWESREYNRPLDFLKATSRGRAELINMFRRLRTTNPRTLDVIFYHGKSTVSWVETMIVRAVQGTNDHVTLRNDVRTVHALTTLLTCTCEGSTSICGDHEDLWLWLRMGMATAEGRCAVFNIGLAHLAQKGKSEQHSTVVRIQTVMDHLVHCTSPGSCGFWPCHSAMVR